ncbi:MAG: DUF456 family protein [Comamonadaceae bacterium]|nr:DUF456 family protein [Comamonadaceae bacterium]
MPPLCRGTDDDHLLWLLALALIAIGAVGTVLPAAARRGAGLRRHRASRRGSTTSRASPLLTLGVLAAMTILAWAVDFVAATLGARRAGASLLALAGAALGTLAGVFTGLWGPVHAPSSGRRSASSWPSGTCCAPAASASRRGSACCSVPQPRSRSCSR